MGGDGPGPQGQGSQFDESFIWKYTPSRSGVELWDRLDGGTLKYEVERHITWRWGISDGVNTEWYLSPCDTLHSYHYSYPHVTCTLKDLGIDDNNGVYISGKLNLDNYSANFNLRDDVGKSLICIRQSPYWYHDTICDADHNNRDKTGGIRYCNAYLYLVPGEISDIRNCSILDDSIGIPGAVEVTQCDVNWTPDVNVRYYPSAFTLQKEFNLLITPEFMQDHNITPSQKYTLYAKMTPGTQMRYKLDHSFHALTILEPSKVTTSVPRLTDEGLSYEETGRYDLTGRPIDSEYHGVAIARYSDGRARKIIVP